MVLNTFLESLQPSFSTLPCLEIFSAKLITSARFNDDRMELRALIIGNDYQLYLLGPSMGTSPDCFPYMAWSQIQSIANYNTTLITTAYSPEDGVHLRKVSAMSASQANSLFLYDWEPGPEFEIQIESTRGYFATQTGGVIFVVWGSEFGLEPYYFDGETRYAVVRFPFRLFNNNLSPPM